MPNLRGLEATREIKIINPEVKVLTRTMHKDQEYLYHAFTAGVEGYLLKEDADSGELISAIDSTEERGHLYLAAAGLPVGGLVHGKIPARWGAGCQPWPTSQHPGAGDHQAHR